MVHVMRPPVWSVEFIAVTFDGEPNIAYSFDDHVDPVGTRFYLGNYSVSTGCERGAHIALEAGLQRSISFAVSSILRTIGFSK